MSRVTLARRFWLRLLRSRRQSVDTAVVLDASWTVSWNCHGSPTTTVLWTVIDTKATVPRHYCACWCAMDASWTASWECHGNPRRLSWTPSWQQCFHNNRGHSCGKNIYETDSPIPTSHWSRCPNTTSRWNKCPNPTIALKKLLNVRQPQANLLERWLSHRLHLDWYECALMKHLQKHSLQYYCPYNVLYPLLEIRDKSLSWVGFRLSRSELLLKRMVAL